MTLHRAPSISLLTSIHRSSVSPHRRIETTGTRSATRLRSSSTTRPSVAGLSVLEVVIALTVLALALTGIMSGVVNGDKARGKRLRTTYATMLAESEIERIRAAASVADSMADTTYAATVERLSFEVQRTIVPNTGTPSINGPVLQEIDISVRRTDKPDPVVRLRLVQGFERKE